MSITLISLSVYEDIWLSSLSSNKSLISSRKISKQHTDTFVIRLNIFKNKFLRIVFSFIYISWGRVPAKVDFPTPLSPYKSIVEDCFRSMFFRIL